MRTLAIHFIELGLMLRITLTTLAFCFLTSIANLAPALSATINNRLITEGMSEQQVVQRAGQPTEKERRKGPGGKRYQAWHYRCRYRAANCKPIQGNKGRGGRSVWILFDQGEVIEVESRQDNGLHQ